MHPLWLLLPYCCLLIMEGARFFLLEYVSPGLAGQCSINHRLNCFKALNIKWYKWLLRSIKDWLVLGILGVIAVSGLMQFFPLLVLVLMVALGLIIFLRAYTSLILLLYAAGWRIPGFLLTSAVFLAVPDLMPASRKRTMLWSGIFFLAGISSLLAGIERANFSFLLWSCLTLTLSFVSLLRSFANTNRMEDSQNAEEAG